MMEDVNKEFYKPIMGYEKLYEVSNFGNVKSLEKIINKGKFGIVKFNEIILKPVLRNKNGYLIVNLYKDKKVKIFQVHRLVAETFIPNINNKPQINHIDANKTNNHIENLEWVTPSENMIHALDNNLLTIPRGERNGMHKLTKEDVLMIRDKTLKISRKELSKLLNVTIKHIDRIRGFGRWKNI
jgi:hypothetical protein